MKKALKYLGIFFLSLVVIAIIALIIFKLANNAYIESSNKEFVSYLNKNKNIFDKNTFANDSSSQIFSDEFYESDFVILGESHGYANVQYVDKSLLLHLNQRRGTRYYVAEMDSMVAKKLNSFLRGDNKSEELLVEVVDQIGKRIPQQAGKELFQKWSDIYDYNKTLADSLQIIVLGIDKNIDDRSKISRDSPMK